MPDRKDADPKTGTKKKAVKKTARKKTTATPKTAKTARKKTAPKRATPPAEGASAAPSARKASAKAAPAGRLRVKQIRSTIHRPKTFQRTLVALGLKHHQDEVVIADTPSSRGMLQKVRHLVSVQAEES